MLEVGVSIYIVKQMSGGPYCLHVIWVPGYRFTSHGSTKSSTAVEYAQKRMRGLEGLHHRENAALKAMAAEGHWKAESEESRSEGGRSQKTWLETVEEEVGGLWSAVGHHGWSMAYLEFLVHTC